MAAQLSLIPEERVWKRGPPPYIGWWLASSVRSDRIWRWWDGSTWSQACLEGMTVAQIAEYSALKVTESAMVNMEYCDDWPEDARVERVDPNE